MNDTEDWLDELAPAQVQELVDAAVFDDASPADRDAAVPPGLPAPQARFVKALRALRPVQRIYLRAYVQGGCNRTAARRQCEKRGVGLPDNASISRWFTNEHFRFALDSMKKTYLDTMGLDPSGTLLKVGRVYEEAMTPKPVLYQGEPTGFEETDLTNAMRAAEFLGRVNKLTTGDEGGARVTLNIVNIADRTQRDVVSDQ